MQTFNRTSAGLFLLFSSFTNFVFAQQIGDQYPESLEMITKGVQAHDNKEYAQAIEKFLFVENGDSLYDLAQYELALSYQADSQFVKALEVVDRLIDHPSSSQYLAKLMKGDLLDYMNRTEESIAWFDSMIAECDYFNRTYYEKAITLLRQKNYDAALRDLEKSLYLNPFHARTHLQIGLFAAEHNQPALALMAIHFASILESTNTGFTYGCILYSEQIGQDTYEKNWNTANPKTMSFAEDLEDINEIVRSKAALTPKYKSKLKGNYTHAKQLQVICEKLASSYDNENLILQFYTKFYKRMWDQGHFVGMAVDPLKSFGDSGLQSLVKKNAKKIQAFETAARGYLDEQVQGKMVTVRGEKKKVDMVFDDGALLAIADQISSNDFNGYALFYHPDGMIQAEGEIRNNVKEGLWKFYTNAGIIQKSENYKSGVVDGTTSLFDNYGRLTGTIQFLNGKEDGLIVNYYPNGARKSQFTIANGKIDGDYIQYDQMQNKEVKFRIKNDQLVDKLVYYNPNGSTSFELPVVNGDPSGYVKNINEQGIVVAEGNMRKKERDGEWKIYHNNGKISEKGSYELGQRTGLWEVFDENGNLLYSENYKNDKLSGKRTEYDRKNRILSEINFRNGRGIEYTYFDADGKAIQTAKTSGGRMKVVNYNDLRIRSSEGEVDDDKRVGVWKEYHANGSLKTEHTYSNNEINGIEKNYHPTGEVSSEFLYKDGLIQGYFKNLDVFGHVTSAGYTLDGQLHGPRWEYYPNGKLKERSFYWRGELCGDRIDYGMNGKIERITSYQNDIVTRLTEMDSTGKIIHQMDIINGNGMYTVKHANGQILMQDTLQYNELHGEVTYYNPQGKVDHINYFRNGKYNGMTTQYHSNGKMASQGMMVDGKREGEWKFYNFDGSLQSKGLYKSGDRNGKMTFYHRNGKVYQDRNYFKDDRDGEFRYYGEDGSLIIVLNYLNGVLLSYTYENAEGKLVPEIKLENETGTIEAKYANGKTSTKFTLKNGEMDGEYLVYHSNGKVHEKFNYSRGENHGSCDSFNSKGVKTEEEIYVDGHLSGVRKEFYDNGKVMSSETMVFGEKIGPASYYDSNGKLLEEGHYYSGYFYKH